MYYTSPSTYSVLKVINIYIQISDPQNINIVFAKIIFKHFYTFIYLKNQSHNTFDRSIISRKQFEHNEEQHARFVYSKCIESVCIYLMKHTEFKKDVFRSTKLCHHYFFIYDKQTELFLSSLQCPASTYIRDHLFYRPEIFEDYD